MPASRGVLRVEVARTRAELGAIAAAWSALDGRATGATGFQSYHWCSTWLDACDACGRPEEFRILTVRVGDDLVMLLPLAIERSWGTRILHWLGEPLAQYGDALCEPDEDFARWLDAAQQEIARWRDIDVVRFVRLRDDGALRHANIVRNSRYQETQVAPFVRLSTATGGGWLGNRKKSLRRRMKRLHAMGEVSFALLDDPSDRLEAAETALRLKHVWLTSKGMISFGLSHKATHAFVLAAAERGLLKVAVLRVGDRVAAVELGFTCGTTYRSLIGSYDPEFAEGSPGHMLIGHMLDHCASLGLDTYDFLAPNDGYKEEWATGGTTVTSGFHAVTAKGAAAAFAMGGLRPLARQTFRAAPAWCRSAITRLAPRTAG